MLAPPRVADEHRARVVAEVVLGHAGRRGEVDVPVGLGGGVPEGGVVVERCGDVVRACGWGQGLRRGEYGCGHRVSLLVSLSEVSRRRGSQRHASAGCERLLCGFS